MYQLYKNLVRRQFAVVPSSLNLKYFLFGMTGEAVRQFTDTIEEINCRQEDEPAYSSLEMFSLLDSILLYKIELIVMTSV